MDEVVLFNPELYFYMAASFADIHKACITTAPYTIATFLPPLDDTRMRRWWEDRFKEVVDGQRIIVMQMAPNATDGEPELAGYVALQMPTTETGPFRGPVEKLLVSPAHRNKGVARRVMAKLEEVAKEKKGTLLVSLLTQASMDRLKFK